LSVKRRYKNRKRRKKKAPPAEPFVILEHASILKRIGAYVIDTVIFGIVYLIFALTILQGTLHIVWLHAGVIITLGQTLYFLLFTWLKGQSLGQIILDIRVIAEEDMENVNFNPFKDYKLSFKLALIHSLGKSFFVILVDFSLYEFFKKPNSQSPFHRISQKLAKSLVVFTPK
jgi:hypothetical protein